MASIAAGALAMLRPFKNFGIQTIKEGLKAAGSFEETTTELETMIGSLKDTQALLGKLTKFAVDTPFEMPQLLNVTRGLVQFGERGDQLMETIKVLGDASGGTAHKFGLLGMVFNQVRGIGRLITQDFRQLSTRGIISLQDIAKYYKKTTSEAQKMLSSGKITFEDFRKILKSMTEEGGRFHNMMQKQSQTLNGLKSTLNDAVNIAKRTIAVPLVPYAKEVTRWMIYLANAVESTVRNGGELISFALAGATAFASLGAMVATGALAAHFFGLTIAKTVVGTGVGAAVIALGGAFGVLANVLLSSNELYAKMAYLFAQIKKIAKPAIDDLTKSAKQSQAYFKAMSDTVETMMSNLIKGITDNLPLILKFVSAFRTGTVVIIGFRASVIGLSVAMRVLAASLRSVLVASGVGLAIIALGFAVEALIKWFKESVVLMHSVSAASKKLNQAWLNLVAAAQIVFTKLSELLIKVTADVINFIAKMMNMKTIEATLESVITAIAEFALNLSEWIRAIAEHWDALWKVMPAVTEILFSTINDMNNNFWKRFLAEATLSMSQWVDIMVHGFSKAFEKTKAYGNEWLEYIALLAEHQRREWGPIEGRMMDEEFNKRSQEIKDRGIQKMVDINRKDKGVQDSPRTEMLRDDLAGLGGLLDLSEHTKKLQAAEGPAGVFRDIAARKKEMEDNRPGLKWQFVGMGFDPERILDQAMPSRLNIPSRPIPNMQFWDVYGGKLGKDFKGSKDFPKGEDAKSPDFSAGRYGFQEVSHKIQDMLVKDEKTDILKQHLDIATEGKEIQQKMLDEMKTNKPGGGGLGE